MLDIIVFFTSIVSFLVFVLGLAHLIRTKGHEGILLSIKRLFLIVSLVSSIFLWFIVASKLTSQYLELIFIHLLLFWSLSFAYILGIFGLSLTSLRIQLLLILVSKVNQKMTQASLIRWYSIKDIVKKRLYRLESSGEIVRRGGVYTLRSKWSYFMLHSYVLLFLTWLYRPIPWKNKTV